MPNDPGAAQGTAAHLPLARPTLTPPSAWVVVVLEEAEIEDAEDGREEGEEELVSTTTAIASDLAVALKKGDGAAIGTIATVATDGLILKFAETPETSPVIPEIASY